jgi:hypothetical protein
LPVTSVKYTYTAPNEKKKVLISNRWDNDYISKYTPRSSTVYPDIAENGEFG